MRGFDGVEMVYNTCNAPDATSHPDDPRLPEVARMGTVLAVVSPSGQTPLDDYADDFLVKLHPSVFPRGKGKRPRGMSELVYFRILFSRVPLSQFGQNPGLTFDMFNLWQRHTVYQQSRMRVKCSSEAARLIGDASVGDMEAAVKVMQPPTMFASMLLTCVVSAQAVGKRPTVLKALWRTMSPAARAIHTAMKQMAVAVPGSPQSKASFRSKAMASPIVHGSATCMINLCPSELASAWVFVIGEPQPEDPNKVYKFGKSGACLHRMEKDVCRRFVAENFWACADFFWAYMRAFNALMLGWPLDENVHQQVDKDCLFGLVLAWMWSFEESTRGGIHAHGLITLPVLQAEHLMKMCTGDKVMQQRILEFGESIACSMMPQYAGRFGDVKPGVS